MAEYTVTGVGQGNERHELKPSYFLVLKIFVKVLHFEFADLVLIMGFI